MKSPKCQDDLSSLDTSVTRGKRRAPKTFRRKRERARTAKQFAFGAFLYMTLLTFLPRRPCGVGLRRGISPYSSGRNRKKAHKPQDG